MTLSLIIYLIPNLLYPNSTGMENVILIIKILNYYLLHTIINLNLFIEHPLLMLYLLPIHTTMIVISFGESATSN